MRREYPLGRVWLLVGLVLLVGAGCRAQDRLNVADAGRLIPTDIAVLELREPRQDLPCTVRPLSPRLGFDLRFHAGFEVSVPLSALAGEGDLLYVLFRVTSRQTGREYYFSQRIRVPEIKEDAKGEAQFQGAFSLGEGDYDVAWLMRDRRERVCSAYWDAGAQLSARDRDIALRIAPHEALEFQQEQFADEPPVVRSTEGRPLSLKLLVNFAPQREGASVLLPSDTAALVSALRGFFREPRVGRYSVVAFNLNSLKVIYRQENAERIDFRAIGEALKTLDIGTVDFSHLRNKNAQGDFLGELLRAEFSSGPDPDALIFLGPKATWTQRIPSEVLKEIGRPGYPVFYMNCNLNPALTPWRDAIGNAVRFFDGDEYTISSPRDLWNAVSDVVTRVLKLRDERTPDLTPTN